MQQTQATPKLVLISAAAYYAAHVSIALLLGVYALSRTEWLPAPGFADIVVGIAGTWLLVNALHNAYHGYQQLICGRINACVHFDNNQATVHTPGTEPISFQRSDCAKYYAYRNILTLHDGTEVALPSICPPRPLDNTEAIRTLLECWWPGWQFQEAIARAERKHPAERIVEWTSSLACIAIALAIYYGYGPKLGYEEIIGIVVIGIVLVGVLPQLNDHRVKRRTVVSFPTDDECVLGSTTDFSVRGEA